MLLNRRERHIVNSTVRKRVNERIAGEDLLEKPLAFEEIFGDGDSDLESEDESIEEENELDTLTPTERATVANMSPSEMARWLTTRQSSKKPKKPKKKAISVYKLRALLRTLPENTLYAYGNKLSVIIPLTEKLLDEGHRVLIFCRQLKMLCIVDECLQRKNITSLHYNGSLSSQQREDTLDSFSKGEHNVMLITVGAGGEGITITSADRIIITDPNWNPTVDDQAIDRAYTKLL